MIFKKAIKLLKSWKRMVTHGLNRTKNNMQEIVDGAG